MPRTLQDNTKPLRFIRVSQVLEWTSLSRSTLYQLLKERAFPAQIRLTKRTVVWLESEVLAWMCERLALHRAAEGSGQALAV